jgi:hypothetical protein
MYMPSKKPPTTVRLKSEISCVTVAVGMYEVDVVVVLVLVVFSFVVYVKLVSFLVLVVVVAAYEDPVSEKNSTTEKHSAYH